MSMQAVSLGTVGPPRRPADPRTAEALAPVREAMLRHARGQAAEIIAQARSQADSLLADARAQAARTLAHAREAGHRQGGALAAAERNRGRRTAQAIRLDAQRQAYEEFRARVRAAVMALSRQPGYGVLRERLAEAALTLAGPAAALTDDPDGGVIARAPGVVVECSLSRLADAAADALGPQVTSLWAASARGST